MTARKIRTCEMTEETKEEGKGEKSARTRRHKREIQKKPTVKIFGNDDKAGKYKRDVMGDRGRRDAVSKRAHLPLEKGKGASTKISTHV